MKVRAIFSIFLSITYLLFNLLALFLILNWRVRRARGAFEKQLIIKGMAKEDAKRVGASYSKLKEDIIGTLRTARK
jgi:hypothetical protein